jgi:hypothetical protein
MSNVSDNNPFGVLHFNLVKALCKKQMTAHLLFIHYISIRRNARDKKAFKPWVFNAADIYTTCGLNRGFVKAMCAALVKAGIFKLAGNTRKGSPRFELDRLAFKNYLKSETPLEPINDKKEAEKYVNPAPLPPLPAETTCATAAHLPVLPLHRKLELPVQPLHTDNKEKEEKKESTSKTASCLPTQSFSETVKESSTGSVSVNDGAGSPSVIINCPGGSDPVTSGSGASKSVTTLPDADSGTKLSETPNPFVIPLLVSHSSYSDMSPEERERTRERIRRERELDEEKRRFEERECYRKQNQEREYTKDYWARARENYTKELRERMNNAALTPTQKIKVLKDVIKALNKTGVYVGGKIENGFMIDSKAYPINFTWNQKGVDLAKRFFEANPTLVVQALELILMECCRYAVANPLSGYDAVGFHLVKGAETLTFFMNNLETINCNNLIHYPLPDSTVFVKLDTPEKIVLPERQEDIDWAKAVG